MRNNTQDEEKVGSIKNKMNKLLDEMTEQEREEVLEFTSQDLPETD